MVARNRVLLFPILCLFFAISGCGKIAHTNGTKNIVNQVAGNTASSANVAQNTNHNSTPQTNSDTQLSSLQIIIPSLSVWNDEATQFRETINLNLSAFNSLPSDDYGTSQFVSDFNDVQSEYQTTNQIFTALNTQTSKIEVLINTHHFSKDQKRVDDIAQRIERFTTDCNMANNQIQSELAGEVSLVNQFKNGSTNPSVPYWTFNDWNAISTDENVQWDGFLLDYNSIYQS